MLEIINGGFVTLTLHVMGTVFVAYAALRVHHRVLNEHKIDKKVLQTMHLEQVIGWTGIGMIIIGYFISIFM